MPSFCPAKFTAQIIPVSYSDTETAKQIVNSLMDGIFGPLLLNHQHWPLLRLEGPAAPLSFFLTSWMSCWCTILEVLVDQLLLFLPLWKIVLTLFCWSLKNLEMSFTFSRQTDVCSLSPIDRCVIISCFWNLFSLLYVFILAMIKTICLIM